MDDFLLTEDEDYLDFTLGSPEPEGLSAVEARALGYYIALHLASFADAPIDLILTRYSPDWVVVGDKLIEYLHLIEPTQSLRHTNVVSSMMTWYRAAREGDLHVIRNWNAKLQRLGIQNESITEDEDYLDFTLGEPDEPGKPEDSRGLFNASTVAEELRNTMAIAGVDVSVIFYPQHIRIYVSEFEVISILIAGGGNAVTINTANISLDESEGVRDWLDTHDYVAIAVGDDWEDWERHPNESINEEEDYLDFTLGEPGSEGDPIDVHLNNHTLTSRVVHELIVALRSEGEDFHVYNYNNRQVIDIIDSVGLSVVRLPVGSRGNVVDIDTDTSGRDVADRVRGWLQTHAYTLIAHGGDWEHWYSETNESINEEEDQTFFICPICKGTNIKFTERDTDLDTDIMKCVDCNYSHIIEFFEPDDEDTEE